MDTLRCGCSICAGVDASRTIDEKSAGSSTQLNAVQSLVIGTASEAITDGTPTNGQNPWIDSLVMGGKWIDTPGVSTPDGAVTISCYPMWYYGITYGWDSASLSALDKATFAWECVANINFTPASSQNNADSWFWLNTASQIDPYNRGVLGSSDVPYLRSSQPAQTNFNRESLTWSPQGLAPGGYAYLTLIHEIGHLLGLAHPHDGGYDPEKNVFPGVMSKNDFGDYNQNQGIYTTMSYNDGWKYKYPDFFQIGYGWQATPMALDIAAIQSIYGANTTYASGSNSYLLPKANAAGTYWSCIWDTSGTDLITNDGSSLACTIDLRAASLDPTKDGANAGGYVSYATNIVGGYTIANGVVIENATGGSGNDTINGNSVANSLVGGGGNDSLTGGDGNDSLSGGEGNDLLTGGAGNDSLSGGAGNDTYDVDASGDIVDETITGSAGTDTVQVTLASYTLGSNVENLIFNGTGSFTGTGNTAANSILGGAGSDNLTGGDGNDSLTGGAGNDTLSGGTGNDAIDGGGGSGDTAFFSGKFSHYQITKSVDTYTILALNGTDGSDTVVNCENFKFSDVTKTSENLIPDLTGPVFQSAAVSANGTKIILTYNEILGTTVAATSMFFVKVSNKRIPVSAVAANGSTIEITVASPIKSTQTVSLTYRAPKADAGTSNQAIQDSVGLDAISIKNATVTNNSTLPPPDLSAPVMQSAVVNSDGTKIVLTYSEVLDSTVASTSAFTVVVNKKALAVTSVATNGLAVELTLASTIKSTQAVTLTYRAPKVDAGTSNPAVQDTSGNDAIKFSKFNVTNLSTANKVLNSMLAEFSSNSFPSILHEFNEVAENQAVMASLVGNGITYDPWE